MSLKQFNDTPYPLYVVNGSTPVTGLVFGNIVMNYLRPDDTSFQPYTLDAEHWLEVGGGWYHLVLDGQAVLNEIGPVVVQISSFAGPVPAQIPFTSLQFQEDVIPKTIEEFVPPGACMLFGNLIGANTLPSGGHDINVRIVNQPFVSGSSVGVNTRVSTRSDAQGNFSLELPRLAVVLVDVETAGIRKQFTVPDQDSISLVDALNLPS
jgi:hypothetical protein